MICCLHKLLVQPSVIDVSFAFFTDNYNSPQTQVWFQQQLFVISAQLCNLLSVQAQLHGWFFSSSIKPWKQSLWLIIKSTVPKANVCIPSQTKHCSPSTFSFLWGPLTSFPCFHLLGDKQEVRTQGKHIYKIKKNIYTCQEVFTTTAVLCPKDRLSPRIKAMNSSHLNPINCQRSKESSQNRAAELLSRTPKHWATWNWRKQGTFSAMWKPKGPQCSHPELWKGQPCPGEGCCRPAGRIPSAQF